MKIEHVKWLDHTSSQEWRTISGEYQVSKCQTVGFVVHEDEQTISLASSLAEYSPPQEGDCSLVLTILKANITERKTLKTNA